MGKVRRGVLVAALALLAAGAAATAAEQAEAPDLASQMHREIKDLSRHLRDDEKSLYRKGRPYRREPLPAEESEELQEMQTLRDAIYRERVRLDTRLGDLRFLRRVERRTRRLEMEKGDKDALEGRIEQLLSAYFERRRAHLEARERLAGAQDDDDRKAAEEQLTLRELQLDEARSQLRDLLDEYDLLESGEQLP